MHSRLSAGLGDDERLRLLQEGEDLRSVVDPAGTGPQHCRTGITQHAEARLGHQRVRLARNAVFLHAEQGEMAVREPVEEGARLHRLDLRERRGPLPEARG